VNVATFSYGRVSTADQDARNQRLEIERAGYTVDYWYADEGVSGKVSATQRPQFRELLDKIRDDERLVVAKLDRLGRDAMDIGATIKLLGARRIEVIVLQLGKLDLGSAAGRMILTVLAAMSEMERDLLVERTQSGLARAKAEGKVLGRPARTTAGDRARIVALHAAGQSLSKIAAQFEIGKGTVHAIVKSAKMAAQAPAPTTPAKPAKATRKAAAGRAGDDLADGATLKQEHGRRRLPAV
jgi:DNA invertase Pin-like site-specific DNA recombinase